MSLNRKMHKHANQAYGRPGIFDIAKMTNSEREKRIKNEHRFSKYTLYAHIGQVNRFIFLQNSALNVDLSSFFNGCLEILRANVMFTLNSVYICWPDVFAVCK